MILPLVLVCGFEEEALVDFFGREAVVKVSSTLFLPMVGMLEQMELMYLFSYTPNCLFKLDFGLKRGQVTSFLSQLPSTTTM